MKRTARHCRLISEGQKLAWATKRKRKPLGSKNKDVHGYVRVKVVEGSGRWEKEHTIISEKIIGRKLLVTECVHHINGVRSDNNPENLFVCTRKEHSILEGAAGMLIKGLMVDGIVRFNRKTSRYERV